MDFALEGAIGRTQTVTDRSLVLPNIRSVSQQGLEWTRTENDVSTVVDCGSAACISPSSTSVQETASYFTECDHDYLFPGILLLIS